MSDSRKLSDTVPLDVDATALAFGRTPLFSRQADQPEPVRADQPVPESDAQLMARLREAAEGALRAFYEHDPRIEAGVRAGLLLLFAASTGCYDPIELARRTGYPLGSVTPMAARAVDNEIWVDGVTVGCGWHDEETGWLAFGIDTMVLLGLVKRSPSADGDALYELEARGRRSA